MIKLGDNVDICNEIIAIYNKNFLIINPAISSLFGKTTLYFFSGLARVVSLFGSIFLYQIIWIKITSICLINMTKHIKL